MTERPRRGRHRGATDPPLRALLLAHRAAIADRWYAAIARTSFSPRREAEVRAVLLELTDQAVSALFDEPFDRDRARAVGAAVANLHYLQPDALAATIDVLGREIMAALSPRQGSTLQARLASLLGAVAAGFFAQARALILEEQDQVRRALFVARQHAEAAEAARLQAEAAVRTRTDVLNAAAHDLRTPVTTIIGHADLLQMRLQRDPPPPTETLRSHVASIRAGGVRIRAMVEELLDAARLQMGQTLELELEPLDIGALVQEAARPHATSAGAAGIPVTVEATPGLVVAGDRTRLERVVDNLVGNAVKYSREGTAVHVAVCARSDGVAISVRDHGVGIPASELPQLFTPFFRASTARGVAGIGIGLAGAKSIVEQHGGQIAVESVIDRGTTVTITLPAATANAEAMA